MCDTSASCYSSLYKSINFSTQLNSSKREELLSIFWEEFEESRNQSKIPTVLFATTIIIFLGMILFGAFGSSLVIYVVLRKRSMRTRGNLFILNLAISDLTLCLITQPFNLLRLLTGNRNWALGLFMCKFSAMFQGTNIFVSTISITAIAIDRFQCIIYPTANRGSNTTAIKVNYITWITAFILASPLVYFSRITEMNHLQCTEKADNPTTQKFKLFYSLAALIIQYMTPLVIVTIVYYRICLSIRDRKERAIQKICLSQIIRANNDPQNDKYESMTHTNDNTTANKNITSKNSYNDNTYTTKNTSPTYYQKHNGLDRQRTLLSPSSVNSTSASQKEMIDRRHRKAIILSTVIAIVFCLSWLPINTLNVISDMRELEIVTAYDLAFRNLKTYKTNQNISTNNNNNNSTVKIESTAPSGDSMSQHSITILKAISKIKSIEANNIDAITVIITQALCLLLILSSACVNPILYGWLNKSFRSEFYQVFHIHSTILPNIKSSHKNITQDITSNNRNNETGHRYIHSEQAEYIEQIPNYQFVNHVTTIDTTRNNSNHKQLIMKKMKECKKSTEKRSLSSTQDSCTVFSLFTSRSVELNSTQMSSNSGSNNTTSNNNNNNNNNSNINNNNSNTNDSYDTISQTIRNSFISKTEDHSTASNEISVQIMNYEQDHAQSLANNRNTVHSNSTSVNTSLKRYFLLDKPEEDDDDECDIIPESDSITDPTHLRYLPDITSV